MLKHSTIYIITCKYSGPAITANEKTNKSCYRLGSSWPFVDDYKYMSVHYCP